MKNRKLKPTLQLTQTECGLCCVRTILEAYDYRLSLTELRQVKEPGRDGLGLQKLKDILEHFNLEAKTYKIKDIKAFTVLNFPVIAYWRNSHYICVESYSEKRVVIMDPSVGRMTLSIEAFQESFSGYVIDTKKGDDFKPRHVKKMSRWKKSFIWPQNMVGLYLKVAIVSILLVGMTLSVPLLTQRFIDHDFAEVSSFHVTLICLGAAAIVMILITYIRTLLSIKMICRFSWHFIQGAFTRVLRLPAKYFTVRAPGEVIYRLNALTRIQDVIGTRLIQAFLDLISGLALLGYVFWTSTTIGIVVLAITLVTLLFLSLTQPFVSSSTDVELHEGSKSQSIQLDAIVSINNVKLGGYVGAYIQDWEESFKKVLNALEIGRAHV